MKKNVSGNSVFKSDGWLSFEVFFVVLPFSETRIK